MKVKVHVPMSHKSVVVNVGRGLQTVKWLATVAAHRARMANYPHGARRLREGNLKFIGRFLPESLMITGTDITIAPTVLVKDAIAELPRGGASFTVPLASTYEVSVDAGNGVQRSLWSDSAFAVSPIARKRAHLRQTAHNEQMRRKELQALRDARKRAEEEDARMTRLLMVDLSDSAAVDDALQSTWTQIRVSNLTNDKTQIDAMKRLFLEHYLPLNDLFLHFSGSTGRSSNACMTKSEFEHLLRHCKLLFPHKHQDAINRIFQAANADRNDDDNSEALLTRFELFESLLMVAMFKFGRQSSQSGFRNTPAEALQKMFSVHLLPASKQLTHGGIRRALKLSVLAPWLASKYEELQPVFHFYAQTPEQPDGALLHRTGLVRMLKDSSRLSAGVFGKGFAINEDVNAAMAAVAAYEADNQTDADLQAAFNRLPAGEPLDALCYHEFMEAVARVAISHMQRQLAHTSDAAASTSVRRMKRGGMESQDIEDYITRAVNVIRRLHLSRSHRSPSKTVSRIVQDAVGDPFNVGEVDDEHARAVNMDDVAGTLRDLGASGSGGSVRGPKGRGSSYSSRQRRGRGRRRYRGGSTASAAPSEESESFSRLTSPIASTATSRRNSRNNIWSESKGRAVSDGGGDARDGSMVHGRDGSMVHGGAAAGGSGWGGSAAQHSSTSTLRSGDGSAFTSATAFGKGAPRYGVGSGGTSNSRAAPSSLRS